MCWQDKLRLNRYKRSLSIVRVMRGIRFAHSFPELGRRGDQGNSVISRLMEIVFRDMATAAAPAKFPVTVRRGINGTRRVLGVAFIQCDCWFCKGKL